MRRVDATFGSLALVLALAVTAHAQEHPSAPASPASLGSTPTPALSPSSGQTVSPTTPIPPRETIVSPAPTNAANPTPQAPSPTPVPIFADPPAPSLEPGAVVRVRLSGVYGTIVAATSDPRIVAVVADQDQRALFLTGRTVGAAVITVWDDRGNVARTIQVRVAFAAGTIADEIALRVTGNPATPAFLRDVAASNAQASAVLRLGSSVQIYPESIDVRGSLGIDDRIALDVPVALSGDGYIGVNGNTRVDIENVALPNIQPARLLVSDYPETLTANGVLFSADLDRTSAQRFLYYHYNPSAQPERRILLRVTNAASQPATVQFISGSAGPSVNEMEVGHLSTQRFLVRELQNEGSVITVPANATINLVNHALPPGAIVSALLQLREIDGDPLHLTLLAQDATAPLDQSVDTTQLLAGGVAHARGEYEVPEFYFDYSYPVSGDSLEIPIGQLPLPNLRQGEALAGDYGVQQVITVTIVNDGAGAAPVAIYANPRGGRSTGTFLIDRTLVQAHALPPFSRYKIWQETIEPRTFRRVQIITMPEGGSSYPLRLIFAPDDGSVPPGAPGSPIY